EVSEGFKVPTLIIDATLQMELVKLHWQQAELVADIDVDAPHQHVLQVTNSSFSKNRLVYQTERDEKGKEENGQKSEKQKRYVHYKQREVHAFLAKLARAYAPRQVLAVVQKGLEQALPEHGKLPPNLALAHHNAIAGLDCFKDVAAMVVVGRTQP